MSLSPFVPCVVCYLDAGVKLGVYPIVFHLVRSISFFWPITMFSKCYVRHPPQFFILQFSDICKCHGTALRSSSTLWMTMLRKTELAEICLLPAKVEIFKHFTFFYGEWKGDILATYIYKKVTS